MNYNNAYATTAQSQARVNSFIYSVYNWMGAGLAITGVVAWLVQQYFIVPPMIFFAFIIAELGMVFYLSARIQKIQASTATALFIGYAALNGVTLSLLFAIYTPASIASTFFICAAMFGACSVYGMVTKRDLTSVGNFMFMGLIGIIIATVVNLFLRSQMIYMVVSYIGVIVFVGLTAYDTQKIKHMALSQPSDLSGAVVRKGAIIGALSLYLDFINLFIMLLRIFGDRR